MLLFTHYDDTAKVTSEAARLLERRSLMIIAVAGRRIDAPEAKEVRFPLQNVELVSTRVRAVLVEKGVAGVVSAAACGADLIVLAEAISLGLRSRIVLPYSPQRFRETSVVDRPGEWGPVYDRVIEEAESHGDLVVIPETADDGAYAAANEAILDEAIAVAARLNQRAAAVLVWDGVSRGGDDVTESF